MAKKIKKQTDADDFENLKELGYEFESPQDTYSDQPDSGSTANGIMGKQEYGIDISADALNQDVKPVDEEGIEENFEDLIPGESEWSQKNTKAQEIEKRAKF